MMLHEGQGYEGIDDTDRCARYFVSGLVLVGKLRACLINATDVSFDFVQKLCRIHSNETVGKYRY